VNRAKAQEDLALQIYSNNYANFRFKMPEWTQFQRVMNREKLNKSDTLRMIFHLGLQAYYASKGIDYSRPGRGPAPVMSLSLPIAAQQEV